MAPMAAAIKYFWPHHLIIAVLFFNIFGAQSTKFTIKNHCPFKIWPATLTGTGAQILTGFQLSPQGSKTLTVNAPWSGRVWARTGCSGSPFTCQTGDCGTEIKCNGRGGKPPVTLVEFTLNGDGNKDFYDISLVDGFNLPVSVQARNGCPETKCAANINAACPNKLAVRRSSSGGEVTVACRSACVAFNKPQFCCTGKYNTSKTCKPTEYSRFFKNLCPQAYSYAYDDPSSTFTCPTGGNYVITFCP